MNRDLIIVVTVLCCVAAVADAQEQAQTLVSVYLPREAKVSVKQMTLGSFAVVRCQDEVLAARASAVAMGQAPWSNDEILVDRQTVLSRLASEGFSADQVHLTGALDVVITRNETTITSDQLVAAANRFVSENQIDSERIRLKLSQTPQELVVPAGAGLTFQADWADSAPDGHVAVRVTIISGGQAVGERTVQFRMVYLTRKVVTTREIQPGDTISPQNTRVVVEESARPQAEDWSPPYGTKARTRLAVGIDVQDDAIKNEAAPVVIERNSDVMVKVEGPGFVLTCQGTALQDGRTGDVIRVRNADSKRVITAKVQADGSVVPAITAVVLEVPR